VTPGPTENRVCIVTTKCNSNEFELKAATKTSDRTCEVIAPTCTSSQYEALAPTKTSDRACKTVSPRCAQATQWEVFPPGPTQDRRCADLTLCKDTEYQSTLPTYYADRVCTRLSTCELPAKFEAAAPTATSDRVCQAVRPPCDPAQTIEEIPPTMTSDRICIAKSGCSSLAKFTAQVCMPLDLLLTAQLVRDQYGRGTTFKQAFAGSLHHGLAVVPRTVARLTTHIEIIWDVAQHQCL